MKFTRLNKPTGSKEDGAILTTLWRKTAVNGKFISGLHRKVLEYGKREAKTYLKIVEETGLDKEEGVEKDIERLERKFVAGMETKILADTITWKSFIDIYFKVLRVKKIKFVIILNYKEKDETEHSLVFSRDQ